MTDIDRKMRLILALDGDAHISFSTYTGQWYVTARIEIGDSVLLHGIVEHCATPEDAVRTFFERLTGLGIDEYLVTSYAGHRREWRWNGEAFAECTRSEALGPRPTRAQ